MIIHHTNKYGQQLKIMGVTKAMKTINVMLHGAIGQWYVDFYLVTTNMRGDEVVRQLTHLPECGIYASVNCVSIVVGNGLPPVRRQAITWTNADLLSIGPLGINSSEILIKMLNFWFMKIDLKMRSAKWWPFCRGGVGGGGGRGVGVGCG